MEITGYLGLSSTRPDMLVVYAEDPKDSGQEPEIVAFVRPDGLDLAEVKQNVVGEYVWVAGRELSQGQAGPPVIVSEALEIVPEP